MVDTHILTKLSMPRIDSVEEFYDQLAGDYHSMYADWRKEVLRQGEVLDLLIRGHISPAPCAVLDCTCGIGTQAIGLATRNYNVHATDLVSAAVERAQQESETFGVTLTFDVADIRTLDHRLTRTFDVVISCDNAFSHLLEDSDLLKASVQMRGRLRKDGMLLASIRDYDQVLVERKRNSASETPPLPGVGAAPVVRSQPTMPRVFEDAQGRRIIFQIWDWAEDERIYAVNHFHMKSHGQAWETKCFVTRFRALQRSELTAILLTAGFSDVQWLMPGDSGYYQPVVIAYNR